MRTTPVHPLRRALAPVVLRFGPRLDWKAAGLLALVCSTVAWASLPRPREVSTGEQQQWQALGVAPLSSGGTAGLAMAPTDATDSIEFAPHRAPAAPAPEIRVTPRPSAAGPLRIQGRI